MPKNQHRVQQNLGVDKGRQSEKQTRTVIETYTGTQSGAQLQAA